MQHYALKFGFFVNTGKSFVVELWRKFRLTGYYKLTIQRHIYKYWRHSHVKYRSDSAKFESNHLGDHASNSDE